jgi:ribosomal protein S18 acetylase RimI-like enzyme
MKIEMRKVDFDMDLVEYIRQLRNYHSENFANNHYISHFEHSNFMNIKNRENYYVAVCEHEYPMFFYAQEKKLFAGFIGVINDDIRFAVHPLFERKGIGKHMLLFIKDKYPNAVGKVLHHNISSQKLFEKCDYIECKKDEQFIYYKNKE